MLKEKLLETSAIKFGDFTLTSGKKSDYYVDIKDAATIPELLDEIVSEISGRIRAGIVAGVELGAVPLVVATAVRMKIPYIILRKERNHGTKKLIIGEVPKGAEVDLIEDVVTTGNSLLKAVNMLRSNGAKVTRAVCVVDREQGGYDLLKENGVELIPLVRISEIMKEKQ